MRDHTRRAGSGEPMLLIHGIGHDTSAWEPVFDLLAASHDVVALDLPGFGGADALEEEPTAEALARWCAAVMDELGWDTAHLVGNSLGGLVAITLAGQGRARSVTGLSPAGMIEGWEDAWVRSLLWTIRNVAPRLSGVRALTDTAVGRRALLGLVFGRPAELSPDYARAAMTAPANATDFERTRRAVQRPTEPPALDVPVTIAWGTRDALLFPRQADRWGQALPGATVVRLKGLGHVPMPDDPQRVVEVVTDTASRAASV